MEGMIDRVSKNFGIKTPKQKSEDDRADRARRTWQADANARRPKDLKWWINQNFYAGNGELKYNQSNKSLETVKKAGSRIYVNKSRQQVRGLVSYINKEHPFIEVRPGVQSDSAYSHAKAVQRLCQYWYDHLNQNATNKKVTSSGARFGIGWSKVGWDPSAKINIKPANNGGKIIQKVYGEVTDDYCDPFDVYPDFRSTCKADRRRITGVYPRTMDELQQNKKFHANLDKLVPDDKLAASELKQSLLSSAHGQYDEAADADPGQRTVLLLEQFTYEYEGTEPIVRVTYTTPAGVYLYDEIWPLDEDPYEHYHYEIADTIFGSDGAIEHIRPMNQSLNRTASQIEETIQTMGKLHWVTEKGSGVNFIHDKTGMILEVNRGSKEPVQARPAQMPQYIENQMGNLERWIEDEGGMHDAFNGRSPFSRASGDALNSLQEGDSNSLAMTRDNFDDYQVRKYRLMLKTEKHHRKNDRVIRGELDALGVYQWLTVPKDAISLDDEIQVRTGTNMPHSNAAKQELVVNLKKEGIIEAPVALKVLGLPEIENITGDETPHIERQQQELRDLIDGRPIDDPVVSENQSVHMRVIDQLVNSEGWYKVTDKIKAEILDHRQKHMKLQEQATKYEQAMNVEPIKRSESLMVAPKNLHEFTAIERDNFLSKFNVPSDAAEIQVRGSLTTQDPKDALMQADAENNLFVQGEAPKVAIGDNHQVHLDAHNAFMQSAQFVNLPPYQQKLVQEHMSQHVQTMQAQGVTPGLLGNSQTDSLVPDHSVKTANMKAAEREGAVRGEQRAAEVGSAPEMQGAV